MQPILLAIAALATVASSPAAEKSAWPSPAQVELVRARRAALQPARLVEGVDDREPLELVPGDPSWARLERRERRAPPPAPARAAAIASAVAYAAEHNSYALIVWRRGEIELEQYWPGHDASRRYDTASMTKTVTALLLGAAVADRHIRSVDDRLDRYLPALRGSARGALTLRSLLEMSSGIETPPTSDDPASPYWQSALGDDLAASMARWPQPRGEFERFYYANANPQYLAWAIEAATGERYAAYLSRRLWKPIGAHDARLWLDRPGGSARAFCCLQARARDWLLVGRLLLHQGRLHGRQLVPASWIASAVHPSATNPNYGWQIWRGSPHNPSRTYGPGIPAVIPATQPFSRQDVFYLDGSGGQRVYVVPSAQMIIVRIGAPSRRWDDSALPNMLLRDTR